MTGCWWTADVTSRDPATATVPDLLTNCLFSGERLPSEVAHVRRVARKRGRVAAARFALSIASVYARQLRLLGAARTFTFAEESYPYFRHWRVTTFLNERTIEVPIVTRELARRPGASILEIGNVLNQYVHIPHTVVDKYERASGVLNVDVVDFDPGVQYDLIVSISTLEHVGWDETPKEPDKNRARDAKPGTPARAGWPTGVHHAYRLQLASGRTAGARGAAVWRSAVYEAHESRERVARNSVGRGVRLAIRRAISARERSRRWDVGR